MYHIWMDYKFYQILIIYLQIVFTHLKPQGFNRPRRMQGLILEGLATVPVQRLKLEALRERLQEILFNIDDGESETLYGREFFFW